MISKITYNRFLNHYNRFQISSHLLTMSIKDLPKSILNKYEVYDYRHAIAILINDFPEEYKDLCEALNKFSFTEEDILKPGGSESDIPKKFSKILKPLGWKERQLNAKLIVDDDEEVAQMSGEQAQ